MPSATSYDFLQQLRTILDTIFNGDVFPVVLPDNLNGRVAATYSRVGSPMLDISHSGPTGLRQERWQINAWADNYDDAVLKGEAVISALNGVSGTWGSVQVGLSQVTDAIDDRDDVTGWSRSIIDVLVTYK